MGKEFQSQANRWLKVQAAADYLGCCRSLLDKDRQNRLLGIPFSRLGRHIRYDRVDLDAWLESRKERPGEAHNG